MTLSSIAGGRNGLRHCTYTLIIFVQLLLSSITAAELRVDDPDWKLDVEKKDVQVFTLHQSGSDFQAFKAVYDLNAPVENIMAVLSKAESCMEWVLNCAESWGFESSVFSKRYAYSVNDLPWPVTDRDYVLEINTRNADPEAGSNSRSFVMDLYAVDGKVPRNDEYVRVSKQETHYYITALGPDSTRITWLQHTEPAGAIPGWLVNALIVDIPYKSLRALELMAQSDEYANKVVQYDEQGRISGVADAKPRN